MRVDSPLSSCGTVCAHRTNRPDSRRLTSLTCVGHIERSTFGDRDRSVLQLNRVSVINCGHCRPHWVEVDCAGGTTLQIWHKGATGLVPQFLPMFPAAMTSYGSSKNCGCGAWRLTNAASRRGSYDSAVGLLAIVTGLSIVLVSWIRVRGPLEIQNPCFCRQVRPRAVPLALSAQTSHVVRPPQLWSEFRPSPCRILGKYFIAFVNRKPNVH